MSDNPIVNGQPIYPGEVCWSTAALHMENGIPIEAIIRYPGIGRFTIWFDLKSKGDCSPERMQELDSYYRFRIPPDPIDPLHDEIRRCYGRLGNLGVAEVLNKCQDRIKELEHERDERAKSIGSDLVKIAEALQKKDVIIQSLNVERDRIIATGNEHYEDSRKTREVLISLLTALDKTYWSSWQSTASFAREEAAAWEVVGGNPNVERPTQEE